MNVRFSAAITSFIFLLVSGQAHSNEVGSENTPAILYVRVKWGNAVDYGSYLLPVRAYPNLNTCDAERKKTPGDNALVSALEKNLGAALTAEQRERIAAEMQTHICQIVNSADEKSLAQSLVEHLNRSNNRAP